MNGITNAGTVLISAAYGETYDPLNVRFFTWRDGVFSTLPQVDGATWTFVSTLNDRGDIAGVWAGSDGLYHSFVAYRR